MTYNPDLRPLLDDWLKNSDNPDTKALRAQTAELIADLEVRVAEARKLLGDIDTSTLSLVQWEIIHRTVNILNGEEPA